MTQTTWLDIIHISSQMYFPLECVQWLWPLSCDFNFTENWLLLKSQRFKKWNHSFWKTPHFSVKFWAHVYSKWVNDQWIYIKKKKLNQIVEFCFWRLQISFDLYSWSSIKYDTSWFLKCYCIFLFYGFTMQLKLEA